MLMFAFFLLPVQIFQLSHAHDINCNVTQDGGRTLYAVPRMEEAKDCHHSWINVTVSCQIITQIFSCGFHAFVNQQVLLFVFDVLASGPRAGEPRRADGWTGGDEYQLQPSYHRVLSCCPIRAELPLWGIKLLTTAQSYKAELIHLHPPGRICEISAISFRKIRWKPVVCLGTEVRWSYLESNNCLGRSQMCSSCKTTPKIYRNWKKNEPHP